MNVRTRAVLTEVTRRGRMPRFLINERDMLRVRLLMKRGLLRRVIENGKEYFTGV